MYRPNFLYIFVAGWFLFTLRPLIVYYQNYVPYISSKTSILNLKSQPTPANADSTPSTQNIDHFESYHRTASCNFSSLDLYKPANPTCPTNDTSRLLRTMSGGGRIGNDAPYQTRDCDMRWLNTEEICDILSRFERIDVVGDSVMRDIGLAFHVFLRQDLVHGAEEHWRSIPEEHECSCEQPWIKKECLWYSTVGSHQLYPEHRDLMACPMDTTAWIQYHTVLNYPIADDQIEWYQKYAFHTKPPKPHAVVMGAGLWDNVEPDKTKGWVDQIVNATADVSPWLFEHEQWKPWLFVTPNAAHAAKPREYWGSQGNIALSVFENEMGAYVKDQYRIDHLGTYNMSIQTTSTPDGTHPGMRVSLLKVMAILNWLDSLDVSRW